MSFNLETLKTETSQIERKERAILAKLMIETFENDDDDINVFDLWLQEAEKKRYQLYSEGQIQSKAASIVFQEAFASLK